MCPEIDFFVASRGETPCQVKFAAVLFVWAWMTDRTDNYFSKQPYSVSYLGSYVRNLFT